MRNYDFLVIGSGLAGLVFALETAAKGKVAIITKKSLYDCNTDYAQGGIAAVLDIKDSFEEHVNDTYVAGCELGKKEIIRQIVKEAPARIQYLIDLGTKFTLENKDLDPRLENLSLTREGGHSQKRVAYSADSTGHEVMTALIAACRKNENIDIYENHLAIDLITQHHISQAQHFIPNITCWGAYILDITTNEIEIFRARKTMLATGGGAQAYSYNTNPDIATGDGYAMAHLAGARIVNMEFVQFHPTAFYDPEGNPFLISEAVRGEGAILKLKNGDTFMHKYHPLGCLAPRDIVSRAIDFELRKSGDKHLYLDATHIPAEKLKLHFPYIYKKCAQRGVDITQAPIPVVPAAHYFCGGIITTIDGETDIRNLYTAGEVACTGLHGANRLASNSLLEALVISWRAAHHHTINDEVEFPEILPWLETTEFNENEWVIISHNRKILNTIMQGYVGITRSRRLLKYANSRINNIYEEINNFYHHNPVRKEVIETRNIAIVASLIVRSALMRKESRGAHFVYDYPEKDDVKYLKDTII
ncbi:MAG: L-aspartate oxidase [Candidatus Cloacimonetes bacterium]|nr:L-aspartate oxidase [Candidatus Cloacimonadota bacterium]